jgi:Gpi18-like mannosyltransferase
MAPLTHAPLYEEKAATCGTRSIGSWNVSFGSPVIYWLAGVGTTYFVALFTWAFFAGPSAGPSSFLGALVRFNVQDYIHIAQSGYEPSDRRVAFYPLYPFLMRVVSLGLFRDLSTAHLALCGLLISALASLAAVSLLDRLYRIYLGPAGRQLGLALWVFSPTAVFLAMGYSEALFLALVMAGILRSHKQDWLGAGTLIGLSCVTRPFGILAYAALVADYLAAWRRSGRLSKPQFAAFGLGMPGVALLCHLGYQALYLHDPLASIHAEQKNWNQHLLAPWLFPFYISSVITHAVGPRGYEFVVWFNFVYLMASLVLSALVFGSHRFPCGFKVYTGLILLSILCRSSEMSISRFLMVAFPLFMVLADWSTRGSGGRALLVLLFFVVLDVLGTVLFVGDRPFF